MNEPIAIDGNSFNIGRMNARKQFHVARRLSPLFVALLGKDGKINLTAKFSMEEIDVQEIANALSGMSDADCDYVLDACLDVVTIDQNGRAMPIQRGGRLTFDFITMPTMLRLASEVVMNDLGGFIPAAPSSSAEPTAA